MKSLSNFFASGSSEREDHLKHRKRSFYARSEGGIAIHRERSELQKKVHLEVVHELKICQQRYFYV